MSKITKFPVNLLSKLKNEIEKGEKQNRYHDLIKKCNDSNIKRRNKSKLCIKPFSSISHRLDELAQPKKLNLLSVFENNLERISIFQIENFLNVLYHRDHQTPNQVICTIRQNLSQQNKLIKQKKHEIKNLKNLIHREQIKNVATQIDYFINELKEFCSSGILFKLNSKKSSSLQEQINQKLCQLSEELGNFNLMKPVFEPVPDCENDNTEGLFQVQEYFPPIQPIGPNHIGQTLLWQTVNKKNDCEQDVVYSSFNNFDKEDFEEQQQVSVSLNIDTKLDLVITEEQEDQEEQEEQEIDASMFEINKEDCLQLTLKGAAFQLEKARMKAKRATKKKPNDWKCLLDACKTPKWEVNWIDKDKNK